MSDESGRERAHEEFVTPGPLPEGANLPAAEARLLAALEQEIGVPIAPRTRSRSRTRPLLAVAALLAATAGLVWTQGALKDRSGPPVLRGPAAPAPGAWTAAAVATPSGPGRVELSWAKATGATHYEVTFLAQDLSELARVDSLNSTTLILDRNAYPAGLTAGAEVLWRVTAESGRDEIARSGAYPLLLP